jgi:hypothetical protein
MKRSIVAARSMPDRCGFEEPTGIKGRKELLKKAVLASRSGQSEWVWRYRCD